MEFFIHNYLVGMVEALLGALDHSAELAVQKEKSAQSIEVKAQMLVFTKTLRTALHNTFRYGQGTRDMAGPEGLTTEQVHPYY